MSSRPDKSLLWFGKYLSLALTLPGCVAAGYLLGSWADDWLRFSFLRIIGLLLGMAAGLFQIVRELNREVKRKP